MSTSDSHSTRPRARHARAKSIERGIKPRKRTDGSTVYEVANGSGGYVTAKTLREARAVRGEIVSRQARGERILIPKRRKLADVAEEWFAAESGRWRVDYRREMRRVLDREILPEFERMYVNSIGPREVIAYDRKLRARGLSESGAANIQKPLRGLLDHAAISGDIPGNPYRQLPRNRVSSSSTRRKHHEWSDSDISKFISTARAFDERKTARRAYADQIETMIECGLRIAEASGLQFTDIETDGEGHHVLVVRRQLSKRGELHDYVKTSTSARRVPITQQLHDRLRFRQSYFGLAETDFVFADKPNGRPPSHSNFRRRAFAPIVKATGLKLDPDVRVTPHDARHVAASRLGQVLDSDHVALVMGHGDRRTTESIYQHVWGRSDKEQRIRDAMSRVADGGVS